MSVKKAKQRKTDTTDRSDTRLPTMPIAMSFRTLWTTR